MRVAVYAHVAASLATCDQCDLCFRVCLSLDLLCPLAHPHECPAGEYNGYVPPHCLSLVVPGASWSCRRAGSPVLVLGLSITLSIVALTLHIQAGCRTSGTRRELREPWSGEGQRRRRASERYTSDQRPIGSTLTSARCRPSGSSGQLRTGTGDP
jgi:hypothetical protein